MAVAVEGYAPVIVAGRDVHVSADIVGATWGNYVVAVIMCVSLGKDKDVVPVKVDDNVGEMNGLGFGFRIVAQMGVLPVVGSGGRV